MPEDTNETQADSRPEERTFTQEEVNSIVKERLARAKAAVPDDYEVLKEKAARYDEAEERDRSELQKATEKAERLQAQVDELVRQEERRKAISAAVEAYGVDASILSRMTGDIEENAQLLKARAEEQRKYPKVDDGGESATPAMTKADILAIEDERSRLKAIQDNIDLF